MIVTDREDLARRAKYLTTQAKDDPLEFVHGAVGYNYRLTNVLAAMGVAQMEQLDAYVEAKRRIGARYLEALGKLPGVRCMEEASWARSTFWLFTILICESEFGADSREVMRLFEKRGIQTRPLWQPIHLSRAHNGPRAGDTGIAERLNRDGLTLPCSVGLTDEQQSRVIAAFQDIRRGAGAPRTMTTGAGDR